MNEPFVTNQTKRLYDALKNIDIDATMSYYNGHKHVDIAILNAKIFIELDGLHHYIDPNQIERDFKRDHFSDGDDFRTFHVPNIVIEHHCDEVADAISVLTEMK